MRRALAVVVIFALGACVPPAAEATPRGAAAFAVDPSPATRGEPFTTATGWRIEITAAVVAAQVLASIVGGNVTVGSAFLWDATRHEELVVRALRAGPTRLTVELDAPPDGSSPKSEDPGAKLSDSGNLDVRPDLLAELAAGGPVALLFHARVEKAGRTFELDVAVPSKPATPANPDLEERVVVPADDLVFAPLVVTAEKLLDDPVLEQLAGSDHDGDGVVTTRELSAALLDQLSVRTTQVLTSPM